MPTITKRDIATNLSDQTGLSLSDVSIMVDSFIEIVGKNLVLGNDITFRTFGTFELRLAKAKIGRNPKKPDSAVEIPARYVVRFKPGRELKNSVAALVPTVLP